ncbi:MAG: hypothetical protein ACRD0Z_01400 [Acidimicrobiales bacterium]
MASRLLRLVLLIIAGLVLLPLAAAAVPVDAGGLTPAASEGSPTCNYDGPLTNAPTCAAGEFGRAPPELRQETATRTSAELRPIPGALVVAAEGGAGSAAFHYTTDEAVQSIMETGLNEGTYATPTGDLSPLQAHIDLALNPAGGPRNALIQIDLNDLRNAGYDIPQITRVTGAYGMPGGGWEMQFPYRIPPQYLTVIRP